MELLFKLWGVIRQILEIMGLFRNKKAVAAKEKQQEEVKEEVKKVEELIKTGEVDKLNDELGWKD